MTIMKCTLPFIAALLLTACAVPDSVVKTGAVRPTLTVKGAPDNSTLVVDGLVMGPAPQFNGQPNVLLLEEGLHQIEIRQGSTVVHAEKAVISNGESRTITVNAGVR
jgi:hypothetical protein